MNQRTKRCCAARKVAVVSVVALVGLAVQRPVRAEGRVPRLGTARPVTGPVADSPKVVAGSEATLEFRLTPVVTHPGGAYNIGGAYDQSNISGQILYVSQGGFISYWNVQLANWDPDPAEPVIGLRAYQARINTLTFASGSGAPLVAPGIPCTMSAQCAAGYGESGAGCSGGMCNFFWRNLPRPDGLRDNNLGVCTITWDTSWPPVSPLFFAALGTDQPGQYPCLMIDPHGPIYAGSLALYVPTDAYGTYTIEFISSETFWTGPDLIEMPIAARIPGVLIVESGSCCRRVDEFVVSCADNVRSVDCVCDGCTWTELSTCAETGCVVDFGACCDSGSEDSQVATCHVTTIDQCTCEKCTWTPHAECADVVCEPNFVPVPAASQWGLAVMGLLLLAIGKIHFGRRMQPA